jgi:hypothetical protein
VSESKIHAVDVGEHPKGTLVIVGLFGAFFVVAWLFMYFVVFAGRGNIH